MRTSPSSKLANRLFLKIHPISRLNLISSHMVRIPFLRVKGPQILWSISSRKALQSFMIRTRGEPCKTFPDKRRIASKDLAKAIRIESPLGVGLSSPSHSSLTGALESNHNRSFLLRLRWTSWLVPNLHLIRKKVDRLSSGALRSLSSRLINPHILSTFCQLRAEWVESMRLRLISKYKSKETRRLRTNKIEFRSLLRSFKDKEAHLLTRRQKLSSHPQIWGIRSLKPSRVAWIER